MFLLFCLLGLGLKCIPDGTGLRSNSKGLSLSTHVNSFCFTDLQCIFLLIIGGFCTKIVL